jgi:hypothetical protein
MDLTTTEQIIIAFAAFWGAILSTVSYVQKLREDSPRITVDQGMTTEHFNNEVYIVLIVRNFGKKAITLSYAYVEEIPKISTLQQILNIFYRKQNEFPSGSTEDRINKIEVSSHKNFAVPILVYDVPDKWLKNQIDPRGTVVDQLGREYHTKIIHGYKYPFA